MNSQSSIPLTRPSTDDSELAAVAQVLASGWLAGQGPQGTLLESGFASLTSRRHAVAVNNCTAGLHLALAALKIGPGDEVLVADYTFAATAHAVLFCGATPRFVDVRLDTGTIDVQSARERISERTRAIIAVDSLGVPADWKDLQDLAASHDLALIEDAACSAGGIYRGAPCGSFGDVAVFSLHARKGITCGEGGVIVTDSDQLADAIRRTSCFGMTSAFARQDSVGLAIPEFTEIGYNYKLSDLLASVALVQLGKLQRFTEQRRAIAARYATLLEDVRGVSAPRIPQDRDPTWQTYAVTVDANVNRDSAVLGLRKHGIGSNIGTYALNAQALYDGGRDDCPNSDFLFAHHLALPMFPDLTKIQQDRVIEVLATVVTASV